MVASDDLGAVTADMTTTQSSQFVVALGRQLPSFR